MSWQNKQDAAQMDSADLYFKTMSLPLLRHHHDTIVWRILLYSVDDANIIAQTVLTVKFIFIIS